ncbi:amino acid adenylation domain-containing protein [Rhodococcus fascians]|uniref:non-ribosomal peptide synthetase n=1 Tax=Rhodococcoides fascians TaxID=1828 RepID=UPI0024BA8851|nr:non-ribosomal peptide synthetase [Rhodococcus fascians]MDJ0427191.1 amino acid adenylation domain-containing protein [Rhodococcus fascians]
MSSPDDNGTSDRQSEPKRRRPERRRPERRRRVARAALFPQLLTAAVELDPHKIAVTSAADSMTYEELDRQSSRLARVLIDRGAGPDTVVALGVRRSVGSVLAIWAIAKSGAAYVPVDPKLPAERIAHMVSDSGATLGVTIGEFSSRLPSGPQWLVLDEPGTQSEIDSASAEPILDEDRLSVLLPEHPAYIIYTSGSTGTPKGVVVTHTGLQPLIETASELYGLDESTRFLHICALSFDPSVLELLCAFHRGGSLVVAPPDIIGGTELSELLVEHRVTHTIITPGVLGTVDAAHHPDVRVVSVGGDASTEELVGEWAPGRSYFNGYGPTETTIISCYARLEAGRGVTIGNPVPRTAAIVLDSRLQPAPDGTPGELYLAGPALARGYLGRSGLTSDRFVANPFGGPGERMYRTGDLVRVLPSTATESAGELQYLGRTDFQVKLRGLRIELGEIESALARHPAVTGAVAVVTAAGGNSQLLVAYLTTDAAVEHAELADLVREHLPSYMVPSVFVDLDRFPLNANGKLDRAALPAADLSAAVTEYRAPSTETEVVLAEAFAHVLGNERVGIDDNFFDIGGNSLSATRVIGRANSALGIRIDVRAFFEAPTVARLARLADEEIELGAGGRPPLQPYPRPAQAPLSLAQKRMWFLNQFEPESSVNNIPLAIRLTGSLDTEALVAAVGDVVSRHESLRTVYPEVDGVGHQVLVPAADVLPDLEPTVVPAEEIASQITATVIGGFDVTQRVPLRAKLFRVADNEHVLVLVVHHIAADGFSLVPLTRDVVVAYTARAVGQAPNWTPLAVQYIDYTLWQRDVLGSENDPSSLISAQESYWKSALAGIPGQLDLPSDRPRPAVPSNRGAVFSGTLEPDIAERITALAHYSGTTTFMVVHAALALVLARLSATDDIAIGTPVAGRGDEALDDVVGMFVNTLVLRTEVNPSIAFRDFLTGVRELDLTAFGHADVPFERLVEVISPERSTSRHPLFQVMLSFENIGVSALQLPGLDISAVDIDVVAAKFDLQVTVAHTPESDGVPASMSVAWTYATDLFDESTIRGFWNRFVRVLDAVTADPTVQVGAIDIVDARELEHFGRIFNETDHLLADATLPSLFRDQVARTPSAPALVFEDEVLDYRTFAQRVDRLARYLVASGVGPETRVALMIPRSTQLLVAVHAVVEAGGAYVPVDPDQPSERIAHILRTANPLLVLRAGGSSPSASGDAAQIDLDDLDLSGYSAERLSDSERLGAVRPETTAYVIFTSGSTGLPKGVAVSHAAISNRLRWMQDRYRLEAHDVVLQKTPVTFDVSVWELFWPFVTGASLVVAVPGGHRDPAYLLRVIVEKSVTTLHFVPSLLGVFAEYEDAPEAVSLTRVFASGEALTPKVARAVHRALPGAELHNLYGPTEAAVDVTAHEVTASDIDTVPIGCPVWNTRVHVLDSRLKPVPAGVAGELYLAGIQLARGYIARPDLTADRFVADPFGNAGDRIYRTGDLVRWTEDGEIEYIGRTDFQVKLRGLRIELGEIESAILADESVAAAVVMVRRDNAAGEILTAYVVPVAGRTVDTSELLADVARRVPEYMVPAVVVSLDEFPLGSSGKLDRKALPAPVLDSGTHYREPATEVERIIASVFADVLGRERIGADDSFFALGGDSIVSIQLVSRAKARGVVFTPRDVFEHKTIAGLAEIARRSEDAVEVLEELDGGGVGWMPLTPFAQSLVTQGGGYSRFTQNLTLELPQPIDRPSLVETLTAVVDHHDALRARLIEDDRGYGLDVAPPGQVDVDGLVDRVSLDPAATAADITAAASAALDRALSQLDPMQGVMVRFVWVDYGPDRGGRLIVAAHHLVIDGVSWRVIVPDLVAAWIALSQNQVPALPPVGTSLRRWSHGLLEEARSERRAAELGYWRSVGTTVDPILGTRPFDPALDVASTVERFDISIPADVTGELLTSVPEYFRGGVNDGLVTALALALATWRRRRGVESATSVIQMEGHGREEQVLPGADLSRTVGWFTSVFPVGLDLGGIDIAAAMSGSAETDRALKAVKEQLLAVPYRGIGYGLLRFLHQDTALELARLHSGHISFNYLGRVSAGDIPEGFDAFGWLPAQDLGDLEPTVDADMPANKTVDINALVVDSNDGPRLQATIAYASGALDGGDARELADHWVEALSAIARRVATGRAGGLTPSDVPLVDVAQRDIEQWEAHYPSAARTSAVEDLWPLAPLQAGLLFHAQLAQDSVDVYTMQIVLELEGDVDSTRLHNAARALVDRYDSLRVVFGETVDGKPVQIVLGDVEVPWREVDLTSVPASERSDAMAAFAARDQAEQFDLTAGPLLRFSLVDLGDDRYRLVFTNHHVLLDGWSLPLLMKDLLVLYAVRGDASVLPRARSYRSFLAWLGRRDRGASIDAWTRALSGVGDPSSIAAASGQRQISARSGRTELSVDESTTAALADIGASLGVTINTIVQSAWAILLGRMLGQGDVVFGATVSGRPADLVGVEDMVGLFINTVPVRVRVVESESVEALLTRTQSEQADLLEHHHVSLTDIHGAIGRSDLFDTLTVFESYPVDQEGLAQQATAIDGMSVVGIESDDNTHYPLTLLVVADSRIRFTLKYFSDLFEHADAERIAHRFVALLTAMASDASRSIADLPVLLDGEFETVTSTWNEPGTPVGDDDTVVSLFSSSAAEHPTSIALTAGSAQLSYAELDRRSNALARRLIDDGAGPERLVAVALPRSAELIVALLAVAKTGAAYLPVDLTNPAERIAYILDDAQPVSVVTDVAGADSVDAPWASVLILDQGNDRSDELSHTRPSDSPIADHERNGPLRPDNAAYVIYTSGSTGRPKGVVISHRNVVELFANVERKFDFGPEDVWTMFHSFAFDFSVWELWGPLLHGGRLVVVDFFTSRSPEAFLELLRVEQVTVLSQTPSAFYQLAEADRAVGGADLALRYVVFGGEALDLGRLAGWYRRHATAPVLVNMYGITETTVHVSFHELNESMAISGSASAIGRGLPGLAVYVLDSRLQPTPVGMPGEVYVSGRQLSRGYAGRAALSASRFVADPFGEPGGRLYRTGDVARWNSDGVLAYSGRSDSQVQLRGFRIELGEIEAAFLQLNGVAAAVVDVRSSREFGDRLVGYVVAESGVELEVAELLSGVGEFLTSYMVPDSVVLLGALPLTSNGKLDRRALPDPVFEARDYRAPSTPVEELVAGVFAEVLGVPRVGLDDDFFALGGNSLIATQVVARLGAALDSRVGVRELFESSSVAALAAALESTVGAGGRVALVAGPRPDRIPLSLAQQRYWFLNQFDTTSAVDNIPLVVRLLGDLNVEALRLAVADVVERHEALRTKYPAHEGVPYQEIVAADVAVPDIETVDVDPASLQENVVRFMLRGFDVAHEIPLAGRIFRLGEHDFVLAFVVHHISADGASMGPLARDVMVAYESRSRDRAPEWRPLEVQYADFALWQRSVLGSEQDLGSVASEQVAYWQETLAGLPEQLDLPSDRPRPAQQSFRGRTVRFTIDATLHEHLVALARANNATLFMTVHAALAVLLARLSGTRDIAVGTPIAGRGERELDDLIGMFVNTLVLRSDVDPAASFEELLAATRGRDLGAFAHSDVPFERLVEVLNPARSMGRNPLFQVGLTFQNVARSDFELAGLRVGPVEFEMALAKTDLQLTVHDRYDDSGAAADIAAEFTYATDLFDESTVAELARRFVGVLEAIVEDSTTAVGDLPLLSEIELEELVVGRNATSVAVQETSLLDGFAARVAETPNAIAITFEGSSLTYAEFDERVNRLARSLVDIGVGPEALVGLAMRRSIDLVVGMYAIVRAGGAYVPLDPDHPVERIAHIVDTADPVCILTTAADRVDFGNDVHVVDVSELDLSGKSGAALSASELRAEIRPESPAYVIFTSGSTGRPKGVSVSHRAIVNQLVWMTDFYELGADDVYLQKTATTFDVSLWGYFLPLRSGGRLVVSTPDGHRDPVYVADTIAAESVTVTDFVPSMLSVFAAYASPESLESLRHVFVIGEALPAETVTDFQRISKADVHNLYGPTEAAVSATYWRAPASTITSSGLPIGGPEANVRVYVLDARLHPVPAGVPGELYLAGPQLARGYVSRPDLTFDRFVADPFAVLPGDRMYRTGDLVFWNTEGGLGYIGRTDFQVKFRGQRIELGEIDSALLSRESVSQAAAAVVPTATGDQLAAYVVPIPGATVDSAELTSAVAAVLPSYMVPSVIVVLDAFPLNTSGKLDRKSLPVPTFEARKFRAPTTRTQDVVADVFAEVLGVSQVGLDDDFFALGGNSLIATQVVAKLSAATGVDVRLPWLFTSPGVEALAERLDAGNEIQGESALRTVLPLRTGGDAAPLFCIHPMDGLAFCYAGLVHFVTPEHPIYGVQSPALTEESGPQSIDEYAKRYVREIRSAQPEGPYSLLGWSLGGVIAHAVAVELQANGHHVENLLIVDSVRETDMDLFRSEIRQGLSDLGVDAPVGDEFDDITLEQAEVLLRAFRGDLVSITAEQMMTVAQSAVRSPRLIAEYVPGVFRGDVVYFSAEEEHPEYADGAQVWQPFVDGRIENHVVPGSHVNMMSTSGLEVVGPVVARELDRR